MKFKLVFLLVVAAVAVTAQTTEEEGSEAVSTSRSYGDSVLVTLLKVKIGCLNRQMAVCENLLTTATRNCRICECHHTLCHYKLFMHSTSNYRQSNHYSILFYDFEIVFLSIQLCTRTVRMHMKKEFVRVESTNLILTMVDHSKHTATWTLMVEDGPCSNGERMVLLTSTEAGMTT